MPRVSYRVLLDAPIEAVWGFHEDIEAALPALSPPGSEVQVTRADRPGEGAVVVIRAKALPALGALGRVKWEAKYVEYQPPTGSPPHRRAWFVDEQVSGPFKRWRHTHRFEETVDEGREKTWAIDQVEYAPPLGPLGLIADRLIIRRQLNGMFAHRHTVLRQRLSRRR